MKYDTPASAKMWCHRCKNIQWHTKLSCNNCGNTKTVTEMLVTYSEYDGLVTLPRRQVG